MTPEEEQVEQLALDADISRPVACRVLEAQQTEPPFVVEGLVIRPGDKVLIILPKEVPMGQALQISDNLKEHFPGTEFQFIVGATGMAVQRATG